MANNSVVLDSTFVEPHPPIGISETGGPYTVTLLSADANLESFCMYLTGHNGIYDPELGLAATACCTDSLGMVCLPMIACNTPCDTITCCQFGNMSIPNGITPNDDGINDVFEIINSSCCESIAIKVFNRWGNMVYQSDDYQNDWKAVNQDGTKLVQGTYFIILTLPTGNERASYIDVRY
jgi:gliding motility-associated-like protein